LLALPVSEEIVDLDEGKQEAIHERSRHRVKNVVEEGGRGIKRYYW
jgi:hypothetical protein